MKNVAAANSGNHDMTELSGIEQTLISGGADRVCSAQPFATATARIAETGKVPASRSRNAAGKSRVQSELFLEKTCHAKTDGSLPHKMHCH